MRMPLPLCPRPGSRTEAQFVALAVHGAEDYAWPHCRYLGGDTIMHVQTFLFAFFLFIVFNVLLSLAFSNIADSSRQ